MMQNADAMVLDTSVVSVLFNRAPESLYQYYRNQIAGSQRVISFQTLEEVWFGGIQGRLGENVDGMNWQDTSIRTRWCGRIRM